MDMCGKDDKAAMSEAVAFVKAIYASGAPLFTKERIKEAHEELQKHRAVGQMAQVKGLDGKFYPIEIRTGKTFATPKKDLEYLFGELDVSYIPVQHLLRSENTSPMQCYCNIYISHKVALRNKHTKGFIYPTRTRSPEGPREGFPRIIHEWQASEPCKELSSILSLTTAPTVCKIIAFACGPIQAYSDDPWSCRSAYQHAMIMTVRGLIGKTSDGADIPCYAQDPAYTDIDRTLLADSGITILDDPDGFMEVDDSSLIISCSPDIPVKQIVSDLALPAIIIWDRVGDGIDEDTHITDPDGPRLKKWICKNYDAHDFPRDIEHFGDLVIYVRRSS